MLVAINPDVQSEIAEFLAGFRPTEGGEPPPPVAAAPPPPTATPVPPSPTPLPPFEWATVVTPQGRVLKSGDAPASGYHAGWFGNLSADEFSYDGRTYTVLEILYRESEGELSVRLDSCLLPTALYALRIGPTELRWPTSEQPESECVSTRSRQQRIRFTADESVLTSDLPVTVTLILVPEGMAAATDETTPTAQPAPTTKLTPTARAAASIPTPGPQPRAIIVPTSTPAPTRTPTPTAAPTGTPTPRPTPKPIVVPASTAVPATTPTTLVEAFSLSRFKNGRWLRQEDPRLASNLENLGWVRDGIDSVESEAVQDLLYIAVVSLSTTRGIVSMDWLQDGIDEFEAGGLRWLNNFRSAEVVSAVVSMGWVEDGIGAPELEAIEEFSYLAYDNPKAALQIIDMPFVQAIEPSDVSAIDSLEDLAESDSNVFEAVMSHPAIRGGITDALSPIVATLGGVAQTNPALIDVLLDTSTVLVERRTVTLPLAGPIDLAIIRTTPGAARAMDLLEQSVRGVEEYLGVPLPTRFVAVLYENAVSGSFAGTNFGTHIAILPKFDVDDNSHEAEAAISVIAHEVAHYYWSGNADWVDEGASDLMASVVGRAMDGRPVGVMNDPCPYAGSISELEHEEFADDDTAFGCNYSLGERIFVDLRRTLGEETFQEGFRNLYLASEIEDDTDNRRGTSVGIQHLTQAFRSDDGLESAVIARWYYGTEPHELSGLDSNPVDPRLPSISGRIDSAYVAVGQEGAAVSVFSARETSDRVYFTLKYSYNVSGGPQEVELEIVEYYEDGFVFGRRSRPLTARAEYIGGKSWYSIGPPPSAKWATGKYWVFAYVDGSKIAEVQFEVTP